MKCRDRDAESAISALRSRSQARTRNGQVNQDVDADVNAVCMKHGIKGLTEHDKSGLGYWHVKMHTPFAVYHCLYLGIAKDLLSWLLVRLGHLAKPKKSH
jgi:hypothetical protein